MLRVTSIWTSETRVEIVYIVGAEAALMRNNFKGKWSGMVCVHTDLCW